MNKYLMKNKVIKILILPIIIVALLLAGYSISYDFGFKDGFRSASVVSRLDTNTTSSLISTEDTTTEIPKMADKNGEKFPTLNLPMRYFDYKYLTSWSSCEGKSTPKDPNCYKIASAGNFKGPYAYQSYPSTNITISGYQNFNKLKPKTLNQIISITLIKSRDKNWIGYEAIPESRDIKDIVNEAFQEYGSLQGHLYPDEVIQSYQEADVTNDGIKEKIVYTCPIMMAGSSCGSEWVFDQDGNLLFWDFDSAVYLEPSEDGNGFYLYNVHPDDSEAGCCERMKNRVKFVYENNKFIPIFQQTVMDVRVEPR